MELHFDKEYRPVLPQIDAKRVLHKKGRFGTRYRETVITNAVLSENDVKRVLHQKRRFGNRFGETVIANPILTQND